MKIELTQINGNKINLLECDNPETVITHFNNPSSQAQTVLDIINQGFYRVCNKGGYNTLIDVGANIGLFSLFVQPVCEDIYAFEPTPSHFNILNILSKPFSNIHPMNLAVGLESGKSKFYLDSVNSTSNSLVGSGNEIEVETLAFEAINKHIGEKIDYLKMDIEGYENILCDQFDFAKFPSIQHIYLEVHGQDLESYRNKWIEKLSGLNYYCNKINSDGILSHKL